MEHRRRAVVCRNGYRRSADPAVHCRAADGDRGRRALGHLRLLAQPDGAADFLIADADSHQRLGNIALTYEDGIGDISYWLADDARGRGVATQALSLFTRWAHTVLDLSELRLWAHVDNHGSRAVAERAGYLGDPERDKVREVKSESWPTVSYVHR